MPKSKVKEEESSTVVSTPGGESLVELIQYEYINNSREAVIMLGDYKLGRVLGQGSSGKVQVATHCESGAKAAVKIINKVNGQREALIHTEELKCLRTLRHDNIVRLISVVDTPKTVYIVMEYCDTDMLSFLNKCPVWLTETSAASLFVQVLKGVKFCHSLGVCHRDLKLENLLLAGSCLKIADFGLSKFVELDNNLSSSAGSPQYLAPELVDEVEQFDGTAADMWSCGVVLYALLFRGLPFDDANLDLILANIQRGTYTLTRPVSDEVIELLRLLLEPSPSKRATAASALESPWILAHADGPMDQVLPGIAPPPAGTTMAAMQLQSTDTMLSSVAKRLELKRRAEAAGIRAPSCPEIPTASMFGTKKRAQDDSRPSTRARLTTQG